MPAAGLAGPTGRWPGAPGSPGAATARECAAAAAGHLLGTLAAWFETDLLIGAPPAGAMLGGMLCGAVYLAYAVAALAIAVLRLRRREI